MVTILLEPEPFGGVTVPDVEPLVNDEPLCAPWLAEALWLAEPDPLTEEALPEEPEPINKLEPVAVGILVPPDVAPLANELPLAELWLAEALWLAEPFWPAEPTPLVWLLPAEPWPCPMVTILFEPVPLGVVTPPDVEPLAETLALEPWLAEALWLAEPEPLVEVPWLAEPRPWPVPIVVGPLLPVPLWLSDPEALMKALPLAEPEPMLIELAEPLPAKLNEP